MSYSRIKPRRGTLYEWSTVNPILDQGELGVVYPDTGIGTGLCKFKIGDGVHKFTELAYAFDGAAAASIDGGTVENFHLIQLRSGTEQEWLLVNPIIAEDELTYDTTNHGFKVGNGVDTWEDLPYTQSGDTIGGIYDYGDEDATDVIASFTNLRSSNNEEEIETSGEISTIADLLEEVKIEEEELSEESIKTSEKIKDEEDPMGENIDTE